MCMKTLINTHTIQKLKHVPATKTKVYVKPLVYTKHSLQLMFIYAYKGTKVFNNKLIFENGTRYF